MQNNSPEYIVHCATQEAVKIWIQRMFATGHSSRWATSQVEYVAKNNRWFTVFDDYTVGCGRDDRVFRKNNGHYTEVILGANQNIYESQLPTT